MLGCLGFAFKLIWGGVVVGDELIIIKTGHWYVRLYTILSTFVDVGNLPLLDTKKKKAESSMGIVNNCVFSA